VAILVAYAPEMLSVRPQNIFGSVADYLYIIHWTGSSGHCTFKGAVRSGLRCG